MAEGGSSHINATGNDRPLLRDLHDHVLIKVADRWKDLGVQLLRSNQGPMLNIIEVNHPHNALSCCKCLFEKWLDTAEDATWNVLIRALRSPSVQLDYLAGQLVRMLTVESVTSSDTGPVCGKMTSIEYIETQFAKMTNRIKQALINNNVDVATLIEQLCAVSAVKTKKVPLFDEDIFEKVKSVNEFWRKLLGFWSIYDYELLQCIVEISECKEAQDILEEFLARIDPSAIDVNLVLDCREEHREGSLKPVLRIKVNSEECTLNVKKRVEDIVTKAYNLEKYALRFQGIKQGCFELLYNISKQLKSYLLQFKISKDSLAEFLAHKVMSMHIDDSVIDITNLMFKRSVRQGQNITLPDLDISPEHRGVAVIIGNSYTKEDVMQSQPRQLLSLPNGPMKDTQSMKEAFDYLKFYTMVRHNLTQDELVSLSHWLANYPLPKSCQRFVLTFSGHGGDGFIYSEDERRVNVSDIVAAFAPPNCKDSLAGIPRLFFFDTCRGDLVHPGIIKVRRQDENWRFKLPMTGNILVAYSTTAGHKAFKGVGGDFWTSILAKKLVSSFESIYDVLIEVNREFFDKSRAMGGPIFQPELIGTLNTPVCLLQECGRPQKPIPVVKNLQSTVDSPSASAQSPQDKGGLKTPKSKLNEFCQSKNLSLPKYHNHISENSCVVVTLSVMIEGQEVRYSYTSEEKVSTKRHIKQCEENIAEIAFTELTNGTYKPNMPPQHTQSYHKQSVFYPPTTVPGLQKIHSHPVSGNVFPASPGKKAKSQLNELFQQYGISDANYSCSDDVTDGNMHNFRATLTYSVHGRKYQYESRGVFSRKQDAEEDTAQQALCEIEQQQKMQPVSRGAGGAANHYKKLLKEKYCDERQLPAPLYNTESTSGGFVSTVDVPQYKPVRGLVGTSKKEAEQLAAMEALRQLKLQ